MHFRLIGSGKHLRVSLKHGTRKNNATACMYVGTSIFVDKVSSVFT